MPILNAFGCCNSCNNAVPSFFMNGMECDAILWYAYNDAVCGSRRGLPRDLVPTMPRFAICGAAAVYGSRFGCLQ